MKSHLAQVSLALLSTVFLFGCQEQGSGPVGLEGVDPQLHEAHEPCKGHRKNEEGCDGNGNSGGGTPKADLTVTNGMKTEDPLSQTVQLQENDQSLGMTASSNTVGEIKLAIALVNTHIVGINACVPKDVDLNDPDDAARAQELLDKLEGDAAQTRMGFFVDIDKNNLGSASKDHKISVTWKDASGGPFDVRLGTARKLRPGEHAVAEVTSGNINGDFTVAFSGGTVLLKNRTGRVRDHFSLACPNEDVVTMVLVRQ